MKQHLSHARCSRLDKAIGEHFSTNRHSLSDMTLTVIERLNRNDIRYRKTKESIHIEQWNLKYRGLNKKKWLLQIANKKFLFCFWYVTLMISIILTLSWHSREDVYLNVNEIYNWQEFFSAYDQEGGNLWLFSINSSCSLSGLAKYNIQSIHSSMYSIMYQVYRECEVETWRLTQPLGCFHPRDLSLTWIFYSWIRLTQYSIELRFSLNSTQ